MGVSCCKSRQIGPQQLVRDGLLTGRFVASGSCSFAHSFSSLNVSEASDKDVQRKELPLTPFWTRVVTLSIVVATALEIVTVHSSTTHKISFILYRGGIQGQSSRLRSLIDSHQPHQTVVPFIFMFLWYSWCWKLGKGRTTLSGSAAK